MAQLFDVIVEARALEHLPTVHGFEARLALMRGNLDAARQWAIISDVSLDSNTLFAFEHALVTKVRVLLALGTSESIAEAEHHLAALRGRAAHANHVARLIEIDALLAMAHEAQGNSSAALASLRDSLAHASRGTFVRSYLDLGTDMLALLNRVRHEIDLPLHLGQALDRVASHVSADPSHPPPGSSVLVTLSLRERDVLELLAQRLSYQEIADQLFISAGTVKRHVSSIYSKLDVSNRREALLKAETLGWALSR
jgi:LuxR family maltose regulon positive regulatory protein